MKEHLIPDGADADELLNDGSRSEVELSLIEHQSSAGTPGYEEDVDQLPGPPFENDANRMGGRARRVSPVVPFTIRKQAPSALRDPQVARAHVQFAKAVWGWR